MANVPEEQEPGWVQSGARKLDGGGGQGGGRVAAQDPFDFDPNASVSSAPVPVPNTPNSTFSMGDDNDGGGADGATPPAWAISGAQKLDQRAAGGRGSGGGGGGGAVELRKGSKGGKKTISAVWEAPADNDAPPQPKVVREDFHVSRGGGDEESGGQGGAHEPSWFASGADKLRNPGKKKTKVAPRESEPMLQRSGGAKASQGEGGDQSSLTSASPCSCCGLELPEPTPFPFHVKAIIAACLSLAVWIAEFVNMGKHHDLCADYGLKPRHASSLLGILFMPLFHRSVPHLLFGWIPCVCIGFYELGNGVRALLVLALFWGVGGLVLWCVGTNTTHVGLDQIGAAMVVHAACAGAWGRSWQRSLLGVAGLVFGVVLVAMFKGKLNGVKWDSVVVGAGVGLVFAATRHKLLPRCCS